MASTSPETLLGILPRELRALLVEILPKWHLLVESELRDLKKFVDGDLVTRSKLCFCDHTARVGSISLIKWARRRGHNWNVSIAANAAMCGHLDYLRWIHDSGCPINHWVCATAVRFNQFHVLRWAVEAGCRWDPKACLEYAVDDHEMWIWIRAHVRKPRPSWESVFEYS